MVEEREGEGWKLNCVIWRCFAIKSSFLSYGAKTSLSDLPFARRAERLGHSLFTET